MEQRNSWMFFGAVIFIGGLLLKNSTKDAELNEENAESARSEKWSKNIEQWSEKQKEWNRNFTQKCRDEWRIFIDSTPKDKRVATVVSGLTVGLVLLYVVLGLFKEMSYWKFMLAIVIFLAGFWVTVTRAWAYKVAKLILIALNLVLLNSWRMICVQLFEDFGWWILILSVIPLLISHFSFQSWNQGLTNQYLVKFPVTFVGMEGVLNFV